MTKEQLDRILATHKAWMNDEPAGIRADLRGADLSGANLSGANLLVASTTRRRRGKSRPAA